MRLLNKRVSLSLSLGQRCFCNWLPLCASVVDDFFIFTCHSASDGEKVDVENNNATEKVISIANRKIQAMFSNGGVSKKNKSKGEINKLKALLMDMDL